MELVIYPSAETAAAQVAQEIAMALRAKPDLVLGLATGSTMESVYAHLVTIYRELKLDFSACHTFNLDEYVGLPGTHHNSYRYYMEEHLFRHINIKPEHTHLPDGMAVDLNQECARYEQLIARLGGIDFQLLGIGQNGHIAFNEPESSFDSRTHVQVLTPATRAQNALHFSPPAQMPKSALTMGMGTILESRRCVLLATGEEKAQIIARALNGAQTSMVPASALRTHPRCLVVLDQVAASQLRQIETLLDTGQTVGRSFPPGLTGGKFSRTV